MICVRSGESPDGVVNTPYMDKGMGVVSWGGGVEVLVHPTYGHYR